MGISAEYGLRLIGLVQKLIAMFVNLFRNKLKPTTPLPPINDKILLKSATDLAELIRNRKVKSEEVVRAYIKRIKEVNVIINAIVDECFTDAIKQAIEIDKFIASKQKTLDEIKSEKPLLGVPITIKESCCVKGLSYTGCSLSRKGIIAENDGYAVALIREAGAIILAVTNTPEFCLNWETNNLIYGRTLNPYNTNYSCGGSSGGEGALIASAGSIFGLGSDVAGSIRIPAAFNGIFGHKPTPKLILLDGHCPISPDESLQNFLVMGPLARYAKDLRLLLKVLVNRNQSEQLDLDEKVDVCTLNIFYKEFAGKSIVDVPVIPEIRAKFKEVVKYLNQLGANVLPATFVDMQYSVELSCANFGTIQDLPNLLENPENPKEYKNILIEIIKSLCGYSNISLDALLFQFLLYTNFFIPRSRTEIYKKELIQMRKLFQDKLGKNGVFLYPTTPISAFLHNESFMKTAIVMYTMIFNILGMPATHVTLGLSKSGIPIGIQVAAAPHQDKLCLAVAEELEKKFGGWVSPSDVNNFS